MAVAQFDVNALFRAGDTLDAALGSVKDRELEAAKIAEEQRRYDEERAWKLEDRNRAAKERQAADAYYGELAKGVQTKGGIYGDALATEANKYALTPDEILKATLYKNDANAARAAGDNTLADKLAWQSKVSDNVDSFMQSGVGEESRPEMYDRINSMVAGQGLPIPKEAILSADQARLFEKTETEKEAKRLKEAKADILKNDQANAWKLVNALGDTSTVLDAEGNEVQVSNNSRNSTRSGTNDLKDSSAGLSRISDAIKKANIDDKYIGTATDDALKARETLIARKNMTPDEASKLVADAIGSKDVGIIFTDNVPKFSEENLLKYADSQTRINNRAGITADNTTSNINSKATQAANLSELLSAQSKTQLGSILEEQAKLARGAEGRRDDSVKAWLQDRGLLDVPKVEKSAERSLGATGKPLEARVNKNIKSIAGIPDSMVASEGVTNTAYKDGKGYSIAMGYNLAANKDSVDKDFKDANISPEKAFIAKTRPQDLVLDDGEAQRLSQVAYYKYSDNLDKKLGGNFDKLSPQMQATALQMHYRGDLYNDAEYSKELRKYVAKDDFNGLVNYVSNNADKLPAPVVRRLENDLGAPVTSNLRGNMSDADKEDYLLKALNKGVNPEKVVIKDTSLYEPTSISAADRLINDYSVNKGGPIDYARYIRNYVRDASVSRKVATEEVDKIIANIKKPATEVNLSEELARRHGGVGGSNPFLEEERAQSIKDLITASDNSEKNRQLYISEKYKKYPSLLSASEKRWIERNKTTVNGRKLLESLGIN